MKRLSLYILLGSLFFVYGRFFVGHAPAGDDIVLQYIPYQALIRDSIRQGQWPMWNPMTFCGRPLMADIQVGTFYPPNWIHQVLPLPLSFSWLFLAHTALLLIGCVRLGRALHLSPPAALLFGVLFTFSTFLTAKIQTGIILFHYSLAWFPWQALALLSLMRRPGPAAMAILSLTLALGLLAGAPQMTFYCWMLVLAIALVYPMESGQGMRIASRVRILTWVAGSFVLAIGLTLAQTFQTYQMAHESFDRGGAAVWDYVTSGSLSPRLLGLLLTPGLFGPGHDLGFYWGSDLGFAESCAYITLWAPWVLMPLGAMLFFRPASREGLAEHRLHRRLFWCSVALAIVAVFLALGRYTPIFRFFYDGVPGFNRFRVPARLMVGFTMGIALGTALVFEHWIHATNRTQTNPGAFRVLIGSTMVVIAILVGVYFGREFLWQLPGSPFLAISAPEQKAFVEGLITRNLILNVLRGSVFALMVIGVLSWMNRSHHGGLARMLAPWLVPILAVTELGWVAWPHQPAVPVQAFKREFYPETSLVKIMKHQSTGGRILWLDDLLDWRLDQNQPEEPRNKLIMQGLPDARGYDPVNARWIGRWFNRLAGLDADENPLGAMHVPQIDLPAWLTLMGVEIILSYYDLSALPNVEARARIPFPEGSLGVWINTAYRGLAFAAPSGPTADNADEAQALSALLAAEHPDDPLAALVYDSALTNSGLDLATEVDESFRVTAIEEGPNRFIYDVDFPRPAVFYFSQSAYPGWRVLVNGESRQAVVAGGAFLAVALDAGQNQVKWQYRPPKGFAWAGAITALAFAALAMILGSAWLRGRLRKGSNARPNPNPSG